MPSTPPPPTTSPPPPLRRRPFLSVIVPAYNEEQRLASTIRAIEDFLRYRPFTWELIVVDDGSRDATIAVARQTFSCPQSRVDPNPRNMGKGATVRRGMLLARGKYRLFTDADNSTPIEQVERLLRVMKARGAAVCIGSRAMKASQLEVRQPRYREMMGRTFNAIVQCFAVPGIRDTQCGFKVFRADAAEYVFERTQTSGFSFDVEALMLARRGGFSIAEVPVRWIDEPNSRVSPVLDSAKMFLDVVRIRLRRYD